MNQAEPSSDPATVARLDLVGITKAFPGTLANDDIHLRIMPGEIHALLGENGAGKSTLVKIIYGVQQADEGEIFWQGEPVDISSPGVARDLGIGMVFQHFSLFEAMTVAENIELGLKDPPPRAQLHQQITEVSASYGLPLDPRRQVHSLSVGEKQRIEIVRCLLQNPRLLIMDEPTSVLSPQEADQLFITLKRLASEGVSILYISHKLYEIKALCDTATILRGGRFICQCDPARETPKSMAQMMVGSEVATPAHKAHNQAGDIVLSVSSLTLAADQQFGTDLHNINFDVRAGEIIGIAGVAGNGQKELLQALNGERLVQNPDAIRIDGTPMGNKGPNQRRTKGLAFVPEDRLGHGSVPEMPLTDNALLSGYRKMKLVKNGMIRKKETARYADDIVRRFDVRTSGTKVSARNLSGGNLQKFIMGREMLQAPRLMIAAHPTWGVDAGATAAIHQALIDLAANGAAVLVVSQDLDEIFEISTRIAAISEGRLSKTVATEETSRKDIGLLMTGGPL